MPPRDQFQISDQDLLQELAAPEPAAPELAVPPAQGVPGTPFSNTERNLLNEASRDSGQELDMEQRFMMGLIRDDPQLQQRFLKRQGIESRIDGDRVMIDDGRGGFMQYNPEGIDTGDIIEYLPEIAETAIFAVATSFAPATLGASVAAGAAAAGGVEAAKQTLAGGLGLRDEPDFGSLAGKTIAGGVAPAVVKGASSLVTKAGRSFSQKVFGGSGREIVDKAGIKEAAKLIGAKPTAGQVSESGTLRATESILGKQRFNIGGTGLRQQVRVNENAMQNTAEGLLKSRSNISAAQSGDKFLDELNKSVVQKLKPAEKLYAEVEQTLKRVPVDQKTLQAAFDRVLKSPGIKTSPSAKAVINKLRGETDQIKMVGDLKDLRSTLMSEISPNAPGNAKRAATKLYDSLTKEIDRSYRSAVNELKEVGVEGSERSLVALKSKLDHADQIWRDTAKQVQNSLLNDPNAKLRGGVKGAADDIVRKIAPEKRVEKFLPVRGPAKIEAIERLSPQAFEAGKRKIVEDIAQKATSSAKGSHSGINIGTLTREIEKLDPAVAKKVFGENGVLKAKALVKFYRSIPRDINPSGTASALEMQNPLNPLNQIGGMSVSALRTFLTHKGDVTQTALFTALSNGLDVVRRDRKSKTGVPRPGL